MPRPRSVVMTTLLLIFSTFLVGCGGEGDTLNRQPVAGTITLDGKPLEKGSITFMPADPQKGNVASAEISAGTYKIEPSQGLVPGGYRVIISSPSGDTAPVDSNELPGQAPPPSPDLIPPIYNSETTLNAEITEGENVKDFQLKK